MNFSVEQLDALIAVVDTGSFEAAAAALYVTPSAISQRVKALEQGLGRVLVQRARPVLPTESGEVVLQMARQVVLLRHDLARELAVDEPPGAVDQLTLPIVVNGDSLATWFMPALAEFAGRDDVVFDLLREDERRSSELLRTGRVMAAVSATAEPVQGCSVTTLGALRYLPAATPAFIDRWIDPHDVGTLGRATVVDYDHDDELQRLYLATLGVEARGSTMYIRSSHEFADAIRAGLGWGMVPEAQFDDSLALLPFESVPRHLDVTLYWQRWRLESPLLREVSAAVERAARAYLRPV